MTSWGSNRYAPLSEWYSRPSKRELQQDKRLAGLERKLDAILNGTAADRPSGLDTLSAAQLSTKVDMATQKHCRQRNSASKLGRAWHTARALGYRM